MKIILITILINCLLLGVLLGDGGNDVSMIQAANVGIGLVGKVSLTSPYTIFTCTLRSYLFELMVWMTCD